MKFRLTRITALALGLLWAPLALAQDPAPDPVPSRVPQPDAPVEAPKFATGAKFDLYWNDRSLWELLQWFSDGRGENFIIADKKDLEGKKVTIISHKKVSGPEAWQAFISALELHGLTIVKVGNHYKVVQVAEAGQRPLEVRTGDQPIPYSDRVITQLLPLKNISVDEITKVITSMAPSSAKIVAYAPSNTLIITDTAHNLRKIQELINELDIAAPRSTLQITPVVYADAAELASVIEEVYGTAEESSEPEPANRRRRRRRRRRRDPEPETTDSVTAGEASKYISKVMSDERTNTLIVLANEDGHEAVADLVAELDIDVDLSSRSQIHVVRLEHAKAEDVTKVLSELSENSSQGGGRNNRNANPRTAAERRAAQNDGGGPEEDASTGGAVAAFDSGMRIAADDNTNSLIIIATKDDFQVIKTVIDELDVVRRQVFVDAVVLELSGQDSLSLGLAAHGPMSFDENATGFLSGQFGAQSFGLSQDALSGLAFGVFGEAIEVPLSDGSSLSVPAFGVALNAIRTDSQVNIVSNPNLLTLDNEKASIVVGRKIPFPTTSGLNNLGQPVVSFQREDVAITLEVTPRVNSSNYVTLELVVEVQEVEEDDSAAASSLTAQAGFITSKRKVETFALVKDNQTVVLGGLMGSTENRTERKVPILGDIPLIGALFRSSSNEVRKSNLMVFITPHIIDDEEDMWEIMRVKEAQRQEFMRRFYGKNSEQQAEELRRLLQYSMNYVDQPSLFRGPTELADLTLDGEPVSDETRDEIEEALEEASGREPGEGAGTLPDEPMELDIDEDELPEAPDDESMDEELDEDEFFDEDEE